MGHKQTRPKPQRLQIAKQWLPTYTGRNIAKGYRKKFAVDIMTAIRELQELGVQFKPEYISAVEASERGRILHRQERKQARLAEQRGFEELYESMDIWDDFYYGEVNDSINIMDNHRVNFENNLNRRTDLNVEALEPGLELDSAPDSDLDIEWLPF